MTRLPSTLTLSRGALALHLALASLLGGIALFVMVAAQPPADAPRSDARVYAQLALGLHEFGVFGRYRDATHAPTPAMDVAPLYPWLVAQVMRADDALRDTLVCVLDAHGDARGAGCPHAWYSLVHLQTALLVLTLTLLWATAYVWTARPLCAWAAWLAALGAGIVPEFAPVMLTEALTLPLGGLFTLALALHIKRHGTAWPLLLAGLALGLLALTRPSFWYLLLASTALALLRMSVPRWRRGGAALLLMCGMGALVTLPWLVRNQIEFDRLALSGGDYGGRSLLQRLAYNDMTLAEFGAAFIYWLPDFGDSLARRLLPPASFARLGWDEPHTFYRQGVARMRADMQRGVVKSEVGTLLRNEVLSRPLEHGRASLALAWRGIFIGKSWGLVAWLCAALALWRGWRSRQADFLLLCLPALFLCLFQAAVSVSIPRYNLLFLPPLALAMGMQLERLPRRRRTVAKAAAP
jgi:4-amino-4-deoxy-L-arabinose transferase-like glycosyltransferase